MLFFIKGYTFTAFWHFKIVISKHKVFYSWCPLFHNLNKQWSISKFYSSKSNFSVTNKNVKTFLNLLMNQYQNQNVKTDSFSEILKFPEISLLLNEKIKITEDMNSLIDFVGDDEEMQKIVKEEESLYEQQLLGADEKILDTILQHINTNRYKSVIMEIIPGVGGQEAMLFVKDLLNMYIGYFNYLELDYEVMDLLESDISGLRKAVVLIPDKKAYLKLMYEGGIHRVQRTPATDKCGRVHTSTAVVTVLPEPEDVDIKLDEKDLKIDAMRASGPGGQHVNRTNSAVRITHIPSGKAVYCQEDRSQFKNRALALRKLRSMLYEQELDYQANIINKVRKKQMGSKLRNEKIRTYNYNQDRVTDHRISNGTIHNLKRFMKDGMLLEELEGRLFNDMQQKILLEIIEKAQNE